MSKSTAPTPDPTGADNPLLDFDPLASDSANFDGLAGKGPAASSDNPANSDDLFGADPVSETAGGAGSFMASPDADKPAAAAAAKLPADAKGWQLANPSLAQWERVTEWPMVLAALLFLAAYAVPIIWPNLNHWLLNYTHQVIVITWFIFGLDFFFRFWLAKNKKAFIRHNLVDLFSIILPIARPLRLLRLVSALSVLNRIGISTLRGRVIGYAMAFAGVVTFSAALAVTQAERAAGGNISAFRDGLWWAFVTLTSTGYGDFYPISNVGRLIAVALMMTGVMLIGAVSASLASWLVQHAIASNDDPAAEETVDLTPLLDRNNFYDPTHPDEE